MHQQTTYPVASRRNQASEASVIICILTKATSKKSFTTVCLLCSVCRILACRACRGSIASDWLGRSHIGDIRSHKQLKVCFSFACRERECPDVKALRMCCAGRQHTASCTAVPQQQSDHASQAVNESSTVQRDGAWLVATAGRPPSPQNGAGSMHVSSAEATPVTDPAVPVAHQASQAPIVPPMTAADELQQQQSRRSGGLGADTLTEQALAAGDTQLQPHTWKADCDGCSSQNSASLQPVAWLLVS